MGNSVADHLKVLHTAAVDARSGYLAALRDAEKKGMTSLLEELIAMHARNATELALALTNLGESADKSESFTGIAHQSVSGIPSLFGGPEDRALLGLIDAEHRNVSHYDEALRVPDLPSMTRTRIEKQRLRLLAAIASMQTWTRTNVSGKRPTGFRKPFDEPVLCQ